MSLPWRKKNSGNHVRNRWNEYKHGYVNNQFDQIHSNLQHAQRQAAWTSHHCSSRNLTPLNLWALACPSLIRSATTSVRSRQSAFLAASAMSLVNVWASLMTVFLRKNLDKQWSLIPAACRCSACRASRRMVQPRSLSLVQLLLPAATVTETDSHRSRPSTSTTWERRGLEALLPFLHSSMAYRQKLSAISGLESHGLKTRDPTGSIRRRLLNWKTVLPTQVQSRDLASIVLDSLFSTLFHFQR